MDEGHVEVFKLQSIEAVLEVERHALVRVVEGGRWDGEVPFGLNS